MAYKDPARAKAYVSAWAKRNRARLNLLSIAWRKRNPEKELAIHRRYRARHKYKIRAQSRVRMYQFWKDHPEIMRQRGRKYHAAHPIETKYGQLRYRSIRRNLPFTLSKGDLITWYENQEKKCAYCDLKDLSLDMPLMTGKTAASLTLDRKDPKLPYTLDNLVLSCWFCNRAKGTWFSSEEWWKIAQLYVKPKWQVRTEVQLAAA